MSRARTGEKARKRRREKKARSRFAGAGGHRQITRRSEVVECLINRNWFEAGEATPFVLARRPDGGLMMSTFLIDLWCMGLKDAWGRLEISHAEFDDGIRDTMPDEMRLIPISLEEVRRMVAGSIRFARENGFRLPRRYDRWTAVLGDLGDLDHADLSDFGVDGKLRVVTTLSELRRRLVGQSLDEFLDREDVEFVLGDEGDSTFPDDVEDDPIETLLEQTTDKVVSAVRRWCFANGITPRPRLAKAWEMQMLAIAEAPSHEDPDTATGDPQQMDPAARERINTNLAVELQCYPTEVRHEIVQAVEQIIDFMNSFDDSEGWMKYAGIGDEVADAPLPLSGSTPAGGEPGRD